MSKRAFSEEHRQRIALSRRGKRHSPETRQKIGISLRGRKRGPHSEEAKAKMRAAHRKRWLKGFELAVGQTRQWLTERRATTSGIADHESPD